MIVVSYFFLFRLFDDGRSIQISYSHRNLSRSGACNNHRESVGVISVELLVIHVQSRLCFYNILLVERIRFG